MNTIDNARAIEAALQVLQGPPASGKLIVKATAATPVLLQPGSCAYPITGNATEPKAGVYVTRNPANNDDTNTPVEARGTWSVTQGGTLVDVESIQGGLHTNRDPATSYRWDPPIDGIELRSAADSDGITGGSFSGAFAGLKQFSHIKTLNFPTAPGQNLFQMNISTYPAAVLAFFGMAPLDGPLSAAPGPRSARTGVASQLYRNTWQLYLITSKLDSMGARSLEGQTFFDDVIQALTWATRVRDRCFIVSGEPGAQIQDGRPIVAAPQQFVDQITLECQYALTKPARTDYNDWLRTRLRQQVPDEGQLPLIDLPNAIVPMPPNGPGSPPFP